MSRHMCTIAQTWNLTVTSSKPIITVTDRIQTDTVLTFGAVFFCTIVCNIFNTISNKFIVSYTLLKNIYIYLFRIYGVQ